MKPVLTWLEMDVHFTLVAMIVKEELAPVLDKIQQIQEKDLPALQGALEKAGAPYTPGRVVGSKN